MTTASMRQQVLTGHLSRKENNHELFFIPESCLLPYWLEELVNTLQLSRSDADAIFNWAHLGIPPATEEERERLYGIVENLVGNIATMQDLATAVLLAKEFRLAQYRVQVYHGKRYVIFKGAPWTRRFFTGTRYLASNPKLISLGIGKLGAAKAIVGGAKLTIVAIAGFRTVEFLLRDDKTLGYFIGHLATDIVKTVIAAQAALGAVSLLTALTAGGTGLVLGPIALAIVVTGGTIAMLNLIDDRLGITNTLAKKIDDAIQAADKKTNEWFWEAEQSFLEALRCGPRCW